MAEMTLEQRQAIALARARLRLQQPAEKGYEPLAPKNILGAAVEPSMALLSGMVAQPVAGIAGLVNAAGGAMGAKDSDPAEAVRTTAEALTYRPRTEGGQRATEAIGAPFAALAGLADEAGGKVSDFTGSPLIGAMTNATLQVAPGSLLPGKGAVLNGKPSVLSAFLRQRAEGLMQSALKPSASEGKAAGRAVGTLLDEGINVTPGGLGKAERIIGSLDEQVEKAISGSNATVNKGKVATGALDVYNERLKQADPSSDLKAAAGVYHRFVNHPLLPDDIPVQLAQEIKRGTQRSVGSRNYGERSDAATQAEKAIGHNLREEIATAVPDVAPLNARMSSLIEARGMLEPRVGIAGNKNPGGLALLGQSPAQLIAMLLDRSEWTKSMLARGLNPGKSAVPDEAALAMTAPQTFSETDRQRRAIIEALLGRM